MSVIPTPPAIILAKPRGFCAGVDRAIDMVNLALDIFGAPIYVRHEIVHNRFVVDDLRQRGAVFVEDVDEIPEGAVAIFSAHGVSRAVHQQAKQRKLRLFDATCPLVTKVHMEVQKFAKNGYHCILIGHAGHPEVEGTMGQYESAQGTIQLIETLEDVEALTVKNPTRLAYVTQTTLSVEDTSQIIAALRARFPDIEGPRKEDICYATQNRQDAVRALATKVDIVLVVGSANSSNSNRLRELAQRTGTPSYLLDDPARLSPDWLRSKKRIGVTAGASAPEALVNQVLDAIKALTGATCITEDQGVTENVRFTIPKELRLATAP